VYEPQYYNLEHGNTFAPAFVTGHWAPRKPKGEGDFNNPAMDKSSLTIRWLHNTFPDFEKYVFQDMYMKAEEILNDKGVRKTNEELYLMKPELFLHLDFTKDKVNTFEGENDTSPIISLGGPVREFYESNFAVQPLSERHGILKRKGRPDLRIYFFDHPEYTVRWASPDRVRKTNDLLELLSKETGLKTVPYTTRSRLKEDGDKSTDIDEPRPEENGVEFADDDELDEDTISSFLHIARVRKGNWEDIGAAALIPCPIPGCKANIIDIREEISKHEKECHYIACPYDPCCTSKLKETRSGRNYHKRMYHSELILEKTAPTQRIPCPFDPPCAYDTAETWSSRQRHKAQFHPDLIIARDIIRIPCPFDPSCENTCIDSVSGKGTHKREFHPDLTGGYTLAPRIPCPFDPPCGMDCANTDDGRQRHKCDFHRELLKEHKQHPRIPCPFDPPCDNDCANDDVGRTRHKGKFHRDLIKEIAPKALKIPCPYDPPCENSCTDNVQGRYLHRKNFHPDLVKEKLAPAPKIPCPFDQPCEKLVTNSKQARAEHRRKYHSEGKSLVLKLV